jgi:uncharacterized protein YkwD
MRTLFLGVFITSFVASLLFSLARPGLIYAPVAATPYSSYAQNTSRKSLADDIQISELVNAERSKIGLTAVIRNKELDMVAQSRATDMVTRSYYAHKSPDGSYFYDLLKQRQISVSYACENLDLAPVVSSQVFVTDWLSSTQGHKECMLSAHTTYAGYAVARLQSFGLETPEYVVVAIYAAL